MDETKPNIVALPEENVRIPGELIAELRRVAGAAQMEGKKAPKFGDLLMEAWTAAKGSTPAESPPVNNSQQGTTSHGTTVSKGLQLFTKRATEYVAQLVQAGRTQDVDLILGLMRSLTEAYGSANPTAGESGQQHRGISPEEADRRLAEIEASETRLIAESGADVTNARASNVPRTPRKRA